MVRTILYILYFIVPWILTPLALLPFHILKLVRSGKAALKYLKFITGAFSRHLIWMAGGRVSVSGLENIPERRDICFISNHQSYVDIPLIVGYVPVLSGFVAKKELYKVPILNLWLSALGCIKLDRGNARSAITAVQEGVRRIKAGYPLVMFPEGTRSKSGVMKAFKSGSLKLATRAKAIIVPMTISGTYRLFEEKYRVCKGKISLIIHPPLETDKMSGEEVSGLAERLELVIRQGLG